MILRIKGYHIIAQRYATPMGEIDVVACRGSTVAMVEVKHRPTLDDAAAAIQPRQQRRIEQASQHFLAHHPHYYRHWIRFDIMLVSPDSWPRHIPNAWQAAA